MSMVDRFVAYATAFEDAYATDDWSKIEPFFTEDATYHFIAAPPLGGKFEGRTAVFTQFKNSVNGFDRRFDTRKVDVLEGPIEKDGGVWIRWRASYTRAGIPPLAMEGEERAVFVGDRIKLLEDRASDAEVQKIVTYFGQYGSKLKS